MENEQEMAPRRRGRWLLWLALPIVLSSCCLLEDEDPCDRGRDEKNHMIRVGNGSPGDNGYHGR